MLAFFGAGRGLGFAYAKLLAQRGAWVVIHDIGSDIDGADQDSSVAEAAAERLRAQGFEVSAASGSSESQSRVRRANRGRAAGAWASRHPLSRISDSAINGGKMTTRLSNQPKNGPGGRVQCGRTPDQQDGSLFGPGSRSLMAGSRRTNREKRSMSSDPRETQHKTEGRDAPAPILTSTALAIMHIGAEPRPGTTGLAARFVNHSDQPIRRARRQFGRLPPCLPSAQKFGQKNSKISSNYLENLEGRRGFEPRTR